MAINIIDILLVAPPFQLGPSVVTPARRLHGGRQHYGRQFVGLLWGGGGSPFHPYTFQVGDWPRFDAPDRIRQFDAPDRDRIFDAPERIRIFDLPIGGRPS